MATPASSGKKEGAMQAGRDKGRALSKEDLIITLLVAGTVLLAIWIAMQVL